MLNNQLFILLRFQVIELPSAITFEGVALWLVHIYAAIVEIVPLGLVTTLANKGYKDRSTAQYLTLVVGVALGCHKIVGV
jgi:hypothetical protein